MEYTHVVHAIPPVYNAESRVLILGTMPSPASRAAGFYYANPRNRFWRVIAAVRGAPVPAPNWERTRFLLENRIALWDVIAECDISGAADSSIRRAVPNDLALIFDAADIRAVFTTGRTAYKYYQIFWGASSREAHCLHSPSAANARSSLASLISEYCAINRYL